MYCIYVTPSVLAPLCHQFSGYELSNRRQISDVQPGNPGLKYWLLGSAIPSNHVSITKWHWHGADRRAAWLWYYMVFLK